MASLGKGSSNLAGTDFLGELGLALDLDESVVSEIPIKALGGGM